MPPDEAIVVQHFPRAVRETENLWIALADGARLAARLWLPEDAEQNPVPAILEYLPYRKRDGTAVRDALTHPYMAGHGYACLRVDMRGNGDSDGLMLDEYLPQEQDDALEVIAWAEARTALFSSLRLSRTVCLTVASNVASSTTLMPWFAWPRATRPARLKISDRNPIVVSPRYCSLPPSRCSA